MRPQILPQIKNKKDKIILDEVMQLYNFTSDKIKNIFLCGAKIEKGKTLRNFISERFKERYFKYNIVFPEYLFESLLERGEINILKLEHQLASDADIIIMPLEKEAYGTFTELGAFLTLGICTSNDLLLRKIIIISNINYKNDESFVNLGPLKLVSKESKKHVIYFKNDRDDFPNKEELTKLFEELIMTIRYLNIKPGKKELNNIFGLSIFLLIMISIYKKITKIKIFDILEDYFGSKFQFELIEPSLRNLSRNEFIFLNKDEIPPCYSITDIGENYIFEELFENLGSRKRVSKIKALLINLNYRKLKKFNLEEERRWFLEL